MRTDDPSDSTGIHARRPSPASTALVDDVTAALDRCPPLGEEPDPNPWHDLLYERLRDEALPALISDDAITPGASLWTGSRLWTNAFRSAGLQPGDRLVITLPPSPAFVQVLIAALWQGCTVALVPSDENVDDLVASLDARAAVASRPLSYAWHADTPAGPLSSPDSLRSRQTDRTPDIRFLLRTSGTMGHAKWVALSDRNVLSVLASHLPAFALNGARVLSVLPWTHAFGLVLDLFPALLAGAEIIRDPKGGRDPESLVRLRDDWGATHLCAVPLTVRRLANRRAGWKLLRDLEGGVVGGAPVAGPLAERLSHTSLRAGYGQTEAAPGIALGPRGKWDAQYLGRPRGCTVTIADDGELLFEGPNACVGVWQQGGLTRLNPNRTVHTGDLVRREGNDLYFQGRTDETFTLSNGRLVQAGAVEATLKATYPALRDALVFTPDGDDVAVALCAEDPSEDTPSHAAIRDTIGPLGERLQWIASVAPSTWETRGKGTVDRDAMTKRLTETYRAR